jgi:hypothetical protein
MMCLMPVMLAGCAGQQGAQSGDGQQQASEEQAADISYADARVSYLGPKGTYTEEACQHFFEGKGEYLPYETVDDAVTALVKGESNYAVIPQVIHRANRVVHTDEALYSYRMDNRDSITKAPFNPAHMQFFTVSDLVIKFLEKNYPQLCRYARLRRTNFAVSFFRRCAQSGAKGTHEERCLIRQVRKGLFPYLFSAYKPQAKAYGMLIAVCPPLARRLFAPQ